MTHGFTTTTKTATGFTWVITRTEYDDTAGRGVTVTVKNGVADTRAKALGAAKRWVLFFRLGGQA